MMKRTRSLAALAVLQLFTYSYAQDNSAAVVTVKALPKTSAFGKSSNQTNRVQYELRSEHPISIAAGQQLEVKAMMANLAIRSGDGSEPKLTVVQTLLATDEEEARKLGQAHSIEIQSNSKGAAITSLLQKKENQSNGDYRSVTLEILIPKTTNANLETSVGNVSATGLAGSTIIATNAGNISMENLAGVVNAKTSGGNVDARSISGECDFLTEGGNVALSDIQGNAKVVTKGGNFVAKDCLGKLTGSTGGGKIKFTIRQQPKENIKIETGGGNIEIELAKALKMNINATTDVGRITSPFSEKGRDKSTLRSKLSESLNGGGPLLDLSTSAGNVSVQYLDEAK